MLLASGAPESTPFSVRCISTHIRLYATLPTAVTFSLRTFSLEDDRQFGVGAARRRIGRRGERSCSRYGSTVGSAGMAGFGLGLRYLGVEIAKHTGFNFSFKDICLALSGLKAQAEASFR